MAIRASELSRQYALGRSRGCGSLTLTAGLRLSDRSPVVIVTGPGAGKLKGPHLPAQSDSGKDWSVFVRPSGQSLAKRLANGTCDPAEALRILGDAASALAPFHGLKQPAFFGEIVPRALVSPTGERYVLDLGALTFQERGLYAAPEIDDRPGPHSDIFSMGIILHHAVTGSLPSPQNAPELSPNFPERLVPLASRTLAADPSQRIPDAKALQLVLKDASHLLTTPQSKLHAGTSKKEKAAAPQAAAAQGAAEGAKPSRIKRVLSIFSRKKSAAAAAPAPAPVAAEAAKPSRIKRALSIFSRKKPAPAPVVAAAPAPAPAPTPAPEAASPAGTHRFRVNRAVVIRKEAPPAEAAVTAAPAAPEAAPAPETYVAAEPDKPPRFRRTKKVLKYSGVVVGVAAVAAGAIFGLAQFGLIPGVSFGAASAPAPAEQTAPAPSDAQAAAPAAQGTAAAPATGNAAAATPAGSAPAAGAATPAPADNQAAAGAAPAAPAVATPAAGAAPPPQAPQPTDQQQRSNIPLVNATAPNHSSVRLSAVHMIVDGQPFLGDFEGYVTTTNNVFLAKGDINRIFGVVTNTAENGILLLSFQERAIYTNLFYKDPFERIFLGLDTRNLQMVDMEVASVTPEGKDTFVVRVNHHRR